MNVATIHHLKSPHFERDVIRYSFVVNAPFVTKMKVGMLPRRSSNVCSLIAPRERSKGAHGHSVKHISMVVASSA